MSRDPASVLKQQAPDLRVQPLLGKDVPRGQVLVAIQKVLAGEVLPKPIGHKLRVCQVCQVELHRVFTFGGCYQLISVYIRYLR